MSISDVEQPWVEPPDLLDRKKYATFLTKYLVGKDEGFVLNLNAGWGKGKTYFLTHWREEIKDMYPTVYVNAWKSDFSDDPMLAVMSAMHEQLNKYLPDEQKTIEGFSNLLKAGRKLVKGAAPAIAKGLLRTAVGKDAAEELFYLSPNDLAEVAEKSMSTLLKEHAEKEKSVEYFQTELGDMVNKVVRHGSGHVKPLFVYIDELDRCRPTYAIELLEAVKHLFSVKSVVFVVATDSEQLQHSICAIYGEKFGGGEYLKRFFDQEYSLPAPDYESYCRAQASNISGLERLKFYNFRPWNMNKTTTAQPVNWGQVDNLSVFLSFYSKSFELSLRSINQVIVRLEAILSSTEKSWDAVFLLFLLAFQACPGRDINKIREYVLGKMDDEEKESFNRCIINSGDTIRWFSGAIYEAERGDSHENVQAIALAYLTSIKTFLRTPARKRYELMQENASFKAAVMNHLVDNQQYNQNNIEDICNYVDYVEIAGSLS